MKVKIIFFSSFLLILGWFFFTSEKTKKRSEMKQTKTKLHKSENTIKEVKKTAEVQKNKREVKRELAQTEVKRLEEKEKSTKNFFKWEEAKTKFFLNEEKIKSGTKDYFVSDKVYSIKKDNYSEDLGKIIFEHDNLISFLPHSRVDDSSFFPVIFKNHGHRPLHMTGIVVIDYNHDKSITNYNDLEISKMDLGEVKYDDRELKKTWVEISSFDKFEKISELSPTSTKVYLEFHKPKLIRE